LEEIQKHDKMDDAWLIINNKVYDVTSVLDWHPGGKVCSRIHICSSLIRVLASPRS
jgi:nitrate reductase (NAD(P)H)